MKPRKNIVPGTLCQTKNSQWPERNGLVVEAVEYLGYALKDSEVISTNPRITLTAKLRDDHHWLIKCERHIPGIDLHHPFYLAGEHHLYPITPPAEEIEKLRLEAIEDERNEKCRLEKLALIETK